MTEVLQGALQVAQVALEKSEQKNATMESERVAAKWTSNSYEKEIKTLKKSHKQEIKKLKKEGCIKVSGYSSVDGVYHPQIYEIQPAILGGVPHFRRKDGLLLFHSNGAWRFARKITSSDTL